MEKSNLQIAQKILIKYSREPSLLNLPLKRNPVLGSVYPFGRYDATDRRRHFRMRCLESGFINSSFIGVYDFIVQIINIKSPTIRKM